jgi:hypothetical protein
MDRWLFILNVFLFVIVILIVTNQNRTVKMIADKIDVNTKILEDVIGKQNLTVVLKPAENTINTTISESNKSGIVNETAGKVSSFDKPLIVDLE